MHGNDDEAEYTSKELWHQVKSVVRTIEREDGVLIFDDTIQQKPYTDENELICWHFDHSINRFPVLLHRRVFTNKDDSTGILYLACSDLDQHGDALETIYQKRWEVEVFHKTLKSHAALAKSPTKRVRTQSNHVFMVIYAAFSLEWLRIKQRMNPFALRSKLYLKAIRHAFEELQKLKAA